MPRRNLTKISFAGLGLIGTSLMQALKLASQNSGMKIDMSGYDPGFSKEDIWCITNSYGLDHFEPDPSLLYDADIIVLCAPVITNITLLDDISRYAAPGTLVTDVSSTKSMIAAKARALDLPFFGMHPIAGREQQGFRAACPELLAGRLMVICEESGITDTGTARQFLDLVEAAGCVTVRMTPEEHDRIYANISHLPQLISSSLMAHCRNNINHSGPGFASVSRLAGSPWPVWRDIVATNSSNIARELDTFALLVAQLADEVRALELDSLEARFQEANRLYQTLMELKRP